VLVLVAVASALVSLSFRDGDERRLEEEGARLAALLEIARAESRASGRTVRWVPAGEEDVPDAEGRPPSYRFVGLGSRQSLPERWLDAGVRARVDGSRVILLGPDAILPPQRVLLSLGSRQLMVATDGLAPFVAAPVALAPAAPTP